jgi:uncharacterized membrane protein YhhN
VFAVAAFFAVADWAAVIWHWKRVEYVCKPATMVALIAAACYLTPAGTDSAFRTAFLLGLSFSLVGDVALMLPNDRWFLPGLVAFLIAHVAYITGFNMMPPPLSALMLLPVVGLLDVLILNRLVAGLVARGDDDLRIPVVVYGVVLSLTLASGWSTLVRPSWAAPARAAALLGGTLFFASDLMLAWNRFVRRSRLLHVLVIITYHLAQFALTLTLILAP